MRLKFVGTHLVDISTGPRFLSPSLSSTDPACTDAIKPFDTCINKRSGRHRHECAGASCTCEVILNPATSQRTPIPLLTTYFRNMAPHVDLVLVFRSSPGKVLSKPQARENARQATEQYTRLLEVLKNGRLDVVGKRGEQEGQLLVLLHSPENTLKQLVQRERCFLCGSCYLARPHLWHRYSDFLCGLPTTNPTRARDLTSEPLTPADRLRLVYTYVTATPGDGGLGVAPGSSNWDRVESVMVLHDHEFNEAWIRSWTTRQLGFPKFDKIREQVCDSISLRWPRILTFPFSSEKLWRCTFISSPSIRNNFCSSLWSASYSTFMLHLTPTFTPLSSSCGQSLSSNGGASSSVNCRCDGEQRVHSGSRSVGLSMFHCHGGGRM